MNENDNPIIPSEDEAVEETMEAAPAEMGAPEEAAEEVSETPNEVA